jgi:hypothetical protein
VEGVGVQRRRNLTVVNYYMQKMLGFENLGPALLGNTALEIYQYFALEKVFPAERPGIVFDVKDLDIKQ